MKILVAMDTSPASQAALDEVIARPWPAGTFFEVLSVIEPSHLWATSEVAEESAQRAQEAVTGAVERLRAKNWEANGQAIAGHARAVIVERARTDGADLLILGSHGVSAITHFLLGNVAAAMLRYAPCSVEVMRPRVTPVGQGMKILLATDGSELSQAAARSVAERPWPAGTEIEVLSAVELMLPTTRALLEPPFFDSQFIESARASAMQRAQDAIAHARQILSDAGLESSESISVLMEPPKTIIVDEAARWEADLIVLGSHGRHGVDRFLLGSVSEAVAMHAPCSVEVIRMMAKDVE